MGHTREALFESKNPDEKSETTTNRFFLSTFSSKEEKNKKYSERERTQRESTHKYVSRNERRGAFLKRCAHLSLSLSLGVVARDDDDDDRRERERERERKNRKLCAIYFVPFRVRKKNFSESVFFFFLFFAFKTHHARCVRTKTTTTQTEERKRERERETSFSLSRDRKNALLLSALLRVCAGVRKKTILINLKIKQEHKNFSSLLDICFVGFFALVFLDCFFKVHVAPSFSLKVMKI